MRPRQGRPPRTHVRARRGGGGHQAFIIIIKLSWPGDNQRSLQVFPFLCVAQGRAPAPVGTWWRAVLGQFVSVGPTSSLDTRARARVQPRHTMSAPAPAPARAAAVPSSCQYPSLSFGCRRGRRVGSGRHRLVLVVSRGQQRHDGCERDTWGPKPRQCPHPLHDHSVQHPLGGPKGQSCGPVSSGLTHGTVYDAPIGYVLRSDITRVCSRSRAGFPQPSCPLDAYSNECGDAGVTHALMLRLGSLHALRGLLACVGVSLAAGVASAASAALLS